MLLKNKAPSNKPKSETQKSPKSSPKQLKKSILKKSNLLKHGVISACKPVSGNFKMSKVNKDNDKHKVNNGIGEQFVKIENNENRTPEIIKEIIFEVEKPKWDIINLSSTDTIAESGMYYKKEPGLKTFTDVLSISNRVESVNSVSENDSTTIELNLLMSRNTKKRKSDRENIPNKSKNKSKAITKVLSSKKHIDSINSVSEDDSSSIKLNLLLKKNSNEPNVNNNKSIRIRPKKSSKSSTNESSPKGTVTSSLTDIKENKSIRIRPKKSSKSSTNESSLKGTVTSSVKDIKENKKNDMPNTTTCFSLGSIVWAKAPGFCWWPAIVDDDPDFNMFYWYEEENPNHITHYHVTFLDDDVSRCWVSPRNIKIFFPDPAMKTLNTKTCKKAHLKMMQKAIETAEKCLDLEPKVRLTKYSFTVRFTGKTNLWARADIKKSMKPKNVDTFQSLAVETSILETKSNILINDSQQTEIVSPRTIDKVKPPKTKKTTKSKKSNPNDED